MHWTVNTTQWLKSQGFRISSWTRCDLDHEEPIWTHPDFPGCAIIEGCSGQFERANPDGIVHFCDSESNC